MFGEGTDKDHDGRGDSIDHVFTNGCNIKRVKVARVYCLPEYPKEILEMGLR